MCGIFGFIATEESVYRKSTIKSLLNHFMLLSESRGKDASGFALIDQEQLRVLKRPIRAKELIRSKEYRDLLRNYKNQFTDNSPEKGKMMGILGHARMVTNGSEETHENNQPVHKDGILCLHNGIVINDENLWSQFTHLHRHYEVDTEIILNLVKYYRSQGVTLVEAVMRTYECIQGANSIALIAEDLNGIILASSNGSLYFSIGTSGQELIFASEKFILEQVLEHHSLKDLFDPAKITQVCPGNGYAFSFKKLLPLCFDLHGSPAVIELPLKTPPRKLLDLIAPSDGKSTAPVMLKLSQLEKLLFIDEKVILDLKRCRRCLLPETFPFIHFDSQGICNYCHSYQEYQPKGHESLVELVEHHRSTDDNPDCLVPLSGGRDSSYGIHYIKAELGLNPVAYTYDWGMVTDLARRNISRMCGALGIEHILISADIRKKRENIRKNVLAWLKSPDLGTVPLFMAGDKQIWYYANILKKQMGLDIVLFSMNPLERTDFKSAFTGVDENFAKEKHFNLSTANKIRLGIYYAKQFLQNPAYINASLPDSLFAYFSYYLIPHDYHILYDYIRWEEETINNILITEYDWETANDTATTWRIGDGTAAFYNYIYYKMAGFSENDSYRSNLVREGIMTRNEALEEVVEENRPRLESIIWYCDTIGIDFEKTMKVIADAPRLY